MYDDSFMAWEELCPPGHYRIIAAHQLPPPIPQALKMKCNSALIIVSGEVESSTVWDMANLYRYDEKQNAVDQEPFGYVVQSGEFFPSGCLVHHGDWTGRTIDLPAEIDSVYSTQINDILLTQLPNSSGSICELSSDSSNIMAFTTLVSELKKHICED